MGVREWGNWGRGGLFAGGGFFLGEWGSGDFDHEWARIFTNGEGWKGDGGVTSFLEMAIR